MKVLSSEIEKAIKNINTRNLIYKSPFEDRFTNELTRQLNSHSSYFCIEQYTLKLGENKRDRKIDIVGFDRIPNHSESILEIVYQGKNNAWGLEAKLYSPYFRLTDMNKYIYVALYGPKVDFEKLYKYFDHFVILLIQDEIDNFDNIEIEDFEILRNTFNIFNLINPNFEVAKEQINKVKKENRVSECFKKAEKDFGDLATQNNFVYSCTNGTITKNLTSKGSKCPLNIHFMINEFSKKEKN